VFDRPPLCVRDSPMAVARRVSIDFDDFRRHRGRIDMHSNPWVVPTVDQRGDPYQPEGHLRCDSGMPVPSVPHRTRGVRPE
jgi:hypothetical protein